MTEQEQAQAQAEANQQEQEEQEANEKGLCFHCGEKLDDCTGYKCWIR